MKKHLALAAVFLVLLWCAAVAFAAPLEGEMNVGGTIFDIANDNSGPGWNWDADTATLNVDGNVGTVEFINTMPGSATINYTDGSQMSQLNAEDLDLTINGPGNSGAGLTTGGLNAGSLTLNNAKVNVTRNDPIDVSQDVTVNDSDLNAPTAPVQAIGDVNLNGNSHVNVDTIYGNNINFNLAPGGKFTAAGTSGTPVTGNIVGGGGTISLGTNNEITTPDGGYVNSTGGNPIISNPDGTDATSVVVENRASNVTFNTNGGSAVAAQVVPYNTVASKPADPTKAGNTFGGWYADEALTVPFDFTQPITSSTVIYAKWNANPAPTPIPKTGDENRTLLWLILAASSACFLLLKKGFLFNARR